MWQYSGSLYSRVFSLFYSCACNYRCLNERARTDYVKDNCCLCGVGSIKLQTNLKEEDILFVTFENEV